MHHFAVKYNLFDYENVGKVYVGFAAEVIAWLKEKEHEGKLGDLDHLQFNRHSDGKTSQLNLAHTLDLIEKDIATAEWGMIKIWTRRFSYDVVQWLAKCDPSLYANRHNPIGLKAILGARGLIQKAVGALTPRFDGPRH